MKKSKKKSVSQISLAIYNVFVVHNIKNTFLVDFSIPILTSPIWNIAGDSNLILVKLRHLRDYVNLIWRLAHELDNKQSISFALNIGYYRIVRAELDQ